MRNKIKYYMITLAIAAIAIAICFLKGNAAKNSLAIVKELEAITKQVNGINLMTDLRIELLAVVQAISDYDEKYGLITNKDFTFISNV